MRPRRQRFCQTTALGGGCSPGNICVPKLSVSTCDIADGAVACDTGYTLGDGPWFTGHADTRSCSCACGAATGGSCGTTIAFYGTTDCSGSALATMNASAMLCTATAVYRSTKIVGVTAPSCGVATANVSSGALTGTGRQTLCCRP